jgi:riboflavin synthase
MFITKEEKDLVKVRLNALEDVVNDLTFKLSAIEGVLSKVLKYMEPPAKKRGRPPGVKNKPAAAKKAVNK